MITAVQLSQLLQSAIVFGTVIMFGALGVRVAGAPTNAFLVIFIPLTACLVGSMLMGLIYSILTITFRANQNVTGLTLTIFGNGLANFFGGILNQMAGGVGQISVRTTSNRNEPSRSRNLVTRLARSNSPSSMTPSSIAYLA